MNSDQFLRAIRPYGLIPVIKLEHLEDARHIGKGLCDGGLPIAEITFRSEYAEAGIALLCKEFPELLVGAGTVLTPSQADAARSAGARFIVSPGFNPRLVDHVLRTGTVMIPGVSNPSQIEWAIEKGLSVLKFFPAEVLGGVRFLKAVAPVYPQVHFLPSGGIGLENVREYLALPMVSACGGSWLTKAGTAEGIAAEVRKSLNLVRGVADV